jgi:soluble lytic murein transglycosylase-like protein
MKGWKYGCRPNKTWLGIAVTAIFAGLLIGTPTSSAAELQTAALATGSDHRHEADLPNILATADAERYRLIFLLQSTAQWPAADREIAGLQARLLMGRVLAQRYLQPQYKVSYDELSQWLGQYGDEPDAKAIYDLALKRQPPKTAAPPKPNSLALVTATTADEVDYGTARAKPGDGNEDGGLPVAAAMQWQAGLEAWRAGKLDLAGQHFAALAKSPGQTSWTVSAAAFWAARVELKSHRPEHVAYWLGIAAERPHTFYGLIARRLLGVDNYFNFDNEAFTDLDAQTLKALPGGRRALALIEIGDLATAESELRILAARGETPLLQSLAALSDRANLPALSLQLASILARNDGRNHDHALYPVPRWAPRGGFTIDRALVFGVMRQESVFVPQVVSSAGAQGLMQLMPATARLMAAQSGENLGDFDKRMRRDVPLADPELNLTLAQEYIQTLLKDEHIAGNLVFFTLAYNAGPGAVERWKAAATEYKADPLLFLESVPVSQSRIFTERVLTNYWVYRMRLKQPTPDLDSLAAGQWPTYTALDTTAPGRQHVAENR